VLDAVHLVIDRFAILAGGLPVERRKIADRALDGVKVIGAQSLVRLAVAQCAGSTAPPRLVGAAGVGAGRILDIAIGAGSPAGSGIVPLNAPLQTARIRSDAAGLAAQRKVAFGRATVPAVVEPADRVKGLATVRRNKFLLGHARAPGRAAG